MGIIDKIFRGISLTVLLAAIIVNILALTAPKWDSYKGPEKYPITGFNFHQNLWGHTNAVKDFNINWVIKDSTAINEGYKEPIRNMVIFSVIIGTITAVLMVAHTTMEKLLEGHPIQQCILLGVNIALCAFSGYLPIKAAFKFEENHIEPVLSENRNIFPSFRESAQLELFVLDKGYLFSIVSGGLYAFAGLILMSDAIRIIITHIVQKRPCNAKVTKVEEFTDENKIKPHISVTKRKIKK